MAWREGTRQYRSGYRGEGVGDAMTLEKEVAALIRRLRSERAEQERIARGLAGAARAAAITHGNVKEAVANELQRLLWQHGEGEAPAPSTTRKR